MFLDEEVSNVPPKCINFCKATKKAFFTKLISNDTTRSNARIMFNYGQSAPPTIYPKANVYKKPFDLLDWDSTEITRQMTIVD